MSLSATVLVTFDQPPKYYYIVASTRFTEKVLTATAVLHYTNSRTPVSGPLPAGPAPKDVQWSLNQAKTLRYAFADTYELQVIWHLLYARCLIRSISCLMKSDRNLKLKIGELVTDTF